MTPRILTGPWKGPMRRSDDPTRTGGASAKRFLFELAAWLPPKGVERRSEWISDAWLSGQLLQNPNPDRLVEFELGDYPFGDPPMVHKIAVEGYDTA